MRDACHLIACFTGAEIRTLPAGCGDVDFDDFAVFQMCLAGPDVPVPNDCADR